MFDVRLQFITLLLCGILTLLVSTKQAILLVAITIIWVIVQGYMKMALKWLAFCIVFYSIQQWLDGSIQEGFWSIMLLFTIIFGKLLPTIVIASSMAKVPSSKLLASLQKLGIPTGILLAFTVAIRFFPILYSESKIIQENARIRGISYRQPRNWLRPYRLFEYAIVPLLMRTIQLADDLSAAATTRGIDAPYRKTSHYHIAFCKKDVFAVGLVILLLATLWVT